MIWKLASIFGIGVCLGVGGLLVVGPASLDTSRLSLLISGGPAEAAMGIPPQAVRSPPAHRGAPSALSHLAPGEHPGGAVLLTGLARPSGKAFDRGPRTVPVIVKPGDTLMGLLVSAGVERGEAHGAISALTTRITFPPAR